MTTLFDMEESTENVYARYKVLIRSMINSIVVNNKSVISTEDLQQAGALALIVALRSYDPSLGSFQSYLRICIRNALLKQANSFSGVFTVGEKNRRYANQIAKMRRAGVSDNDIMIRLGIKTPATFNSLVALVNATAVDLEDVSLPANLSLDETQLFSMLEDIGLTAIEMEFVNLIVSNHSMDDIQEKMNTGRTTLYEVKASIRDKILCWGQE